ncbi:hypothetical protein WJX84_005052 [Apatococcus fuscideae]|uniref:Uncharacterized protein n=1 Tax=Apatococcus fuscideae TaxID=2026836 RepID=A0AAW1TI06_9CHLO
MAPGILLESQPIQPANLKVNLERLSPIKLVADHFRDAAVSLPPEPESPVPVRSSGRQGTVEPFTLMPLSASFGKSWKLRETSCS